MLRIPSSRLAILLAPLAAVVGFYTLDAAGTARSKSVLRTPPRTASLPPLVFVSRHPVPGDPGSVPGLGPRARDAKVGGRLLVRERSGRIRPLLPAGALFDVSDPNVSWDGTRIVFAGVPAPDSAWRLYTVRADGRGLAPLTRTTGRGDDLDPCWLPDGRVVFASTRFDLRAEEGDVPATNLYVVGADGRGLARITAERNGGEEPTVDARTGRVVYARWWRNRYRAADVPQGIATDPLQAIASEPVDLWHAVSVTPDGDGIRLAGGDPRSRPHTMAYQPALLDDGTLVGVRAVSLALVPVPGRLGLQAFRGGFAEARPIAGLGSARPGSACSPAALPGGRIVFAYDPAGRGDFGLYAARSDGSGLTSVIDLPGTLELDPAPIVVRARALDRSGRGSQPGASPPRASPASRPDAFFDRPYATLEDLENPRRFRFDCLNVFANAGVDQPFPAAPRLARDLRIRFFALLVRPQAAGGDTAVLLRESPVDPDGSIHEHDLPAATPLFEQLVDAQGRVLRSTGGPAHVAGFNFARAGAGTKCVGCHAGHSALPVPRNYAEAKWVNASPSATVEATSVAEGSAGAGGAIDRVARGPIARVGWVAGGAEDERLRLSWLWPIEAKAVVLYAPSSDPQAGTDVRIGRCELALFSRGREVARRVTPGPISPAGTRLVFEPIRIDALEVRPTQVLGRVAGIRRAALAEIETLARLAD